jgi:hypothetical protein
MYNLQLMPVYLHMYVLRGLIESIQKSFEFKGPWKLVLKKNLIATDTYTRRFIIRFFDQNDFDS